MLMKKKKIIFMSLAVILVLAFFINGLMEQQRAELIEQVSSSTVNETKILGEATLVDADGAQPEVSVTVGSVSSGYFADARINRQKARDEAVESKREAAEELGVIAAIIAKESNMESLIKAKGFSDAVVVVGESDVTVVVQSDGLSGADVSKIKEIVMSEASVGAENIVIIEVK